MHNRGVASGPSQVQGLIGAKLRWESISCCSEIPVARRAKPWVAVGETYGTGTTQQARGPGTPSRDGVSGGPDNGLWSTPGGVGTIGP